MELIVFFLLYLVGAEFTEGYLAANPDNNKPSEWRLYWNWPELLGKEIAKNKQKSRDL